MGTRRPPTDQPRPCQLRRTPEAMQVTSDNLRQVARWCHGALQTEGGKIALIEVTNTITSHTTTAHVGDCIVRRYRGNRSIFTAIPRDEFEQEWTLRPIKKEPRK